METDDSVVSKVNRISNQHNISIFRMRNKHCLHSPSLHTRVLRRVHAQYTLLFRASLRQFQGFRLELFGIIATAAKFLWVQACDTTHSQM